MVDNLDAVMRRPFAHPMQPLNVDPFLRLDRHKPDVVAGDSFGNRPASFIMVPLLHGVTSIFQRQN